MTTNITSQVSSRAFLLLTLVGGASAFQTACDLVEPKPGCEVGDSFYGSGMRFPAAADFCNEAVCEAGNVSTTDGECVDCAVMDEETCASSAGCSWYTECGNSGRCRSADLCAEDDDCVQYGVPWTCQTFKGEDCLTDVSTCEPPACYRTFLDSGGNCVDPAGREAEAACCDTQSRCEATGGTWQTSACGHYECGEAPTCSDEHGGCDCGEGKTFGVGYGCLEHSACR